MLKGFSSTTISFRMSRNDVLVVDDDKAPEFVQKYQEMLGRKTRKRKVPDSVSCFRILSSFLSASDRCQMRSAETLMGQAFFKEYFDCSTEDPSGPSPIADRLEVIHAITLSSVRSRVLEYLIWWTEKALRRIGCELALFFGIRASL